MKYYHAFALLSTGLIVSISERYLFGKFLLLSISFEQLTSLEYCASEGRRQFSVPYKIMPLNTLISSIKLTGLFSWHLD